MSPPPPPPPPFLLTSRLPRLRELVAEFLEDVKDLRTLWLADPSVAAAVRGGKWRFRARRILCEAELAWLAANNVPVALLEEVSVRRERYGNVTVWLRNGVPHRDNDLPAIERDVGACWQIGLRPVVRPYRVWCRDGKRHRDFDRPAVEYGDGTSEWFQEDERHRDGDRPAVEWASGSREWWRRGKLHRGGGRPAVKYDAGGREWWRDGKKCRWPATWIWRRCCLWPWRCCASGGGDDTHMAPPVLQLQ